MTFLNPEAAAATDAAAIPRQATAAARRVHLRTLVLIRWIAIVGQTAALVFAEVGLGFQVPLLPAFMVVGASIAMNLFVLMRFGHGARLGERAATWHLGFDVLQLAALLYLTGGLRNPFCLLLLAPVTVSATILSERSIVILSAFTIAAASLLAVAHWPLPWGPAAPDLPLLYITGVWAALVCGIVFIATYVARVAMDARRMSDALAATQLALAREQRVAALGTLAAAAAHELGTPLATIAVVARELARDLPADSPQREDAELLLSQTARCRDILAELARRPDTAETFLRMTLGDLVEDAAAPHARPEVTLAVVRRALDDSPEPHLARTPEIVHGLGNVLANALQFAYAEVSVLLTWDRHRVTVRVSDDGPGFPLQLLGRLGEPYLSGRSGETEHMGLGIFIAQTLIERTGGQVSFANRAAGGAEVAVTWPRAIFETSHGRDHERRSRS
ncbi:MAG: ActS/PrrB/RegB family redox-sensitive histidine kinase [Alphaproteobacteria bacterium]